MENQSVQNPVPEPALTPTLAPISKPRFPVMYLVLSVFILLFLASTAFLYYQNMQLKSMLASYQTPVASPTPSATADPTASWKIFTGKFFQYKYPDDLSPVDQKTNDAIYLYQSKQAADKATNYPLIQIGYSIANGAPKDSNFIEYTNPNGLTVMKNKDAIGGMGNSVVVDAYLTEGTTIYRITIQTTPEGYWETLYPNDKLSENEAMTKEFDLLNQILSTFKFLGQTPDSPSLSTYRNTTYKYQISYNSNFKLGYIAAGAQSTNVPPNATDVYVYDINSPDYSKRLVDINHLGQLIPLAPASEWQKTVTTLNGIQADKYTSAASSFDIYQVPPGFEIYVQKNNADAIRILSTFLITQ